MTAGQTPLWLRRTVVAGLLGGLLLLGFVVMRPFLVAIAWAAIMAYVSWPLHLRVLARLGGRRTWAALVMTVMLTLVLGGSLLWLGLLLRSEGVAGVRAPVFWGAATATVALIPFGAPLIWGSIGAGIGLFVGPVILAILLALWREWDSVNADPQQAPTHPETL
ncbi:MAG: hypothetical protein Q8M93_06045 [Polaromonas sp.]|uniref:hypothetical protein n=1 Tax=Polaromonas sp. TaxID=1869339 RepID=UPI00272EE91B|nr:hypothetical protein [Polaromonas sp.]MDP2450510.1 hypothetical protein [Polaromonas sp.]MDP3246511.1 hypothetical protein [Polaromonas sp.]MDP3755518.1 hypothetical protein [Polaromonas sp.]MDP3825314.1 hypothetical protein [Polaromonas sp.]